MSDANDWAEAHQSWTDYTAERPQVRDDPFMKEAFIAGFQIGHWDGFQGAKEAPHD